MALLRLFAFLVFSFYGYNTFAQVNDQTSYQRTVHPDAQWYPEAGFGMFIHWSISSVKELDLSWPMRAGTQIGWRAANNRLSADSVKKIMDSEN